MTQDEIIEMARQAGFEEQFTRPQDAIVRKGFALSGEFKGYKANNAALEAFAKLVASISEGKWKQAVIDELVCCHIYNSSHEDDPRKAIKDAIAWNVDVALDPQVSSDAQALIDKEREACAKVAENGCNYPCADEIAAAIRARGERQ